MVTNVLPGVVGGTNLPVPLSSEAGDQGQLGQGFDVVDQRWQPVDTPLERPAQGRLTVATIDQVDQGTFLAGQVPAWCRDELDAVLVSFGESVAHNRFH